MRNHTFTKKNLNKSFPSSHLFSYVWDRNVRACQNLGVAPESANARPPGCAKFANAPLPGLSRQKNVPRGGMGTAGID